VVVLTYRGDAGVFTIEFGPGGDPRFPRPCVSTSPGLRLCKPGFFCSSPGALGFPPVLCIANSLKREESYMPSPTPTSWPDWTPTQRLQLPGVLCRPALRQILKSKIFKAYINHLYYKKSRRMFCQRPNVSGLKALHLQRIWTSACGQVTVR